MRDFNKLFEDVQPLIKDTAAYIWKALNELEDKQVETKALNSMVTIVDKTAEEMLVKGLRDILPESSFLTEEKTVEQAAQHPYEWIIDPLDGTTNFIYGIPHFSISVALTFEDNLVMGIVENIPLGETFYATLDGGAFCNGEPMHCSLRKELSEAMLVTGFPYHVELRSPEYLQLIYAMIKQVRGIRRFGSAALDLAYVAAGRFDGYFERHLNPWDISAGALLVQEAGGTVSSFENTDAWKSGSSILAASNRMHPKLLEIISGKS